MPGTHRALADRMKKHDLFRTRLLAPLACALAFVALPRAARADRPRTFDLGVSTAVPAGDWADTTGLGIGSLARLSVPVATSIDLTLTTGYLVHLPKTVNGVDMSSSEYPALGGAIFYFDPGRTVLFYSAAELGLMLVHTHASGTGHTDSDLGGLVGIGLRRGRADVRLSALAPSVTDVGSGYGVMFTAGFLAADFE